MFVFDFFYLVQFAARNEETPPPTRVDDAAVDTAGRREGMPRPATLNLLPCPDFRRTKMHPPRILRSLAFDSAARCVGQPTTKGIASHASEVAAAAMEETAK